MIDEKKFATKKALLDHLVQNKREIESFKKSAIKHGEPLLFLPKEKEEAIKAITGTSALPEDDLENGVIYRTLVLNTYHWMDSHRDVHFDGTFSKSIKENKNIAFVHDHIFQLTARVGSLLKAYEAQIKWTDLGISKTGKATCLLFDVAIKKAFDEKIYSLYLSKEINQHSVGMIYMKLFLCIDDADYKEEFANWNEYFPKVANQDMAEEYGYFWAITEAKLLEGSCVIAGSNELTPTLPKTTPMTEPGESTQKEEPNNKEAEQAAAKTKAIKRLII